MISENIYKISQGIPENVKLVAVSKFHPVSELMEAYEAGQRVFGESQVQELKRKMEVMPKDIEWHFIGHLQTNKVKYIVPGVALIHAVDSPRLLNTINKYAEKENTVMDCLLQIHIATEESKFGFLPDELLDFLKSKEWELLKNIRIKGLMCMASNTDDTTLIRQEFNFAKTFFNKVKTDFFRNENSFNELSMGMSDDYTIAIEEGSTIIRVGSKIFGERIYT